MLLPYVRQMLAAEPFRDRAVCMQIATTVQAPCAFAVCVPVCNEEDLLPTTLAPLDQAFAQADGGEGAAVFVVNDTSDASFALIADWAKRAGRPSLILEVAFDLAIRCAPFARRLALDMGAHIAPAGDLLTTDADTCVAPQWIAANRRLLARQDALVCGTVDLDPADLERLPGRVHECGALERAYGAGLAELWALWTGGAAYPLPVAALGASLAMRAASYRRIGGLPTPSSAEDKALARAARRHGYPVIASQEACVVTSGRTRGRTAGGVSDALRERMTSDNPACDEDLVPVSLLKRRADLWNSLAPLPGREALFLQACSERRLQPNARMRRLDVVREEAIASALLGSLRPGAMDESA